MKIDFAPGELITLRLDPERRIQTHEPLMVLEKIASRYFDYYNCYSFKQQKVRLILDDNMLSLVQCGGDSNG